MGILGKVLSGLEVAAGAALILTGAGALAGAALMTEGLASSGLIGGSVGKFLNSGVGKGIIMAVGIGGAAYSMFGSSILDDEQIAAAQAAGNTEDAASSATASVDSVSKAAGDLVPPPSANSVAAGIDANTSNAFATGPSAAASGNPLPQIQQANAGGIQQAMGDQLQTTQNAVNTGGGSAVGPGAGPGRGMVGQLSQPAGQGAEGAAAPGAAPTASGLTGGIGDPNAVAPNSLPPGVQPAAPSLPAQSYGPESVSAPTLSSDSGGGTMSNFLNSRGGAAAIQAGGSLVGGIGQGITAKQTMQDQINAMQWADRTSSDPKLRAQGLAAAGQPVNVPMGYLQRAQALKGMLANNPANATPGQPGSSNPVPVWQLNSTPRGGMPG